MPHLFGIVDGENKIVLQGRLAKSFERCLAAEPGPGVATSVGMMFTAPQMLQDLREAQEAAVSAQVETEHYAERVRVEAEAYGKSEETIRKLDAAGIPWRRAVNESIVE